MRRSDFAWIAFAVIVASSYGAAKFFSWDPGATSDDRDQMPTAGTHGRPGFHTYWATGFGGK